MFPEQVLNLGFNKGFFYNSRKFGKTKKWNVLDLFDDGVNSYIVGYYKDLDKDY